MDRERVVNVDKSFFDVRPKALEFFQDEGYHLAYEGSTSLVFRKRSGLFGVSRSRPPGAPDELAVELVPRDSDTEIQFTYRFRNGGGGQNGHSRGVGDMGRTRGRVQALSRTGVPPPIDFEVGIAIG